MRKFLPFVITIILALTGCQKESTNDKVMEIINSKQYTAANIDKMAVLIARSTDLTQDQVNELSMQVGDFIRMYAEHLCDSLNDELDNPNLTVEETENLLNNIRSMSEPSKETGVAVYKIEGTVAYDISPLFIADMFRTYLSKEQYELAEIEETEMEKPANVDEEVMVSYQEVADRLWRCDRLMASKNSNDDLKVSLKPYINTYISILMYGAENTPAFDWKTGVMQQDAKDALLNYINEHPDTESGKVLSQYAAVLEKSNFCDCQATRSFYFSYLRNN